MGMNSDYQVKIKAVTDKASFDEVRRSFSQVIDSLSKLDMDATLKGSKAHVSTLATEVQKVQKAYTEAFRSDLGSVNIQKFNKLLAGDGQSTAARLHLVQQAYASLGKEGDRLFKSFATDILTANRGLKQTHTIVDDMMTTMTNTIKWGISSSIMNNFTGAISQATGYVKDLDKSLNDIRIVSGQSAEQMATFAKNANNAAKALGATTLQYSDAALIYYQQGLKDDQVKQMTDITVKMSNVLGSSAGDVSNYMTAIWNNFYEEGGKSLEYYADVITKLGAATASSAEEISTGLEKFAAIADTVGLSYEYATAALTTVTATTRQSADVVGTAFKTLFARIQDLELGNTLEDGVTLGSYSEALQAVGINILEANGSLKDMDDILDEMGSKWGTLTKAQQVSLAQTVAGTRQYTQLVALMDNWDYFATNLQTAQNATGSLTEQQQIYLESTEAHINAANAAWDDFKDSLIDADVINFFSDLSKYTGNFLSFSVDSLGGGLSTIFLGLSMGLKLMNNQLSTSLTDMVFNLRSVKDTAAAARAEMEAVELLKGINVNDEQIQSIANLKKEFLSYGKLVSEEQNDEINALMKKKTLKENELDLIREQLQLSQKLANSVKREGLSEINLTQKDFNDAKGIDRDNESIQDNFKAAGEAFGYMKQKATEYEQILTNLGQKHATLQQELDNPPIQKPDAQQQIKTSNDPTAPLEIGPRDDVKKKQWDKYHKEVAEYTTKQGELLASNAASYKKQWQFVEEHFQEIFKSPLYADEFKQDIEELNAMLEGDRLDTNELASKTKTILDKVRQVADDQQKQMTDPMAPFKEGVVKKELDESNESIDDFKEKLNFAQSTQSWINMASQVGTLTSGIMALTNITDIWGDTTISAGEKVLSILGAVGYSLPMITSSMGALNKSLPKVLKTFSKDASWLKDEKGNAFSTLGEAMGALPLKAKLIAAAVVAAVAIIGVAIWAVVQNMNKAQDQVNNLNKASASLKDQFQELKSEISSVKSAFDEYDSIITTLDGCTKGTQEWVENLQKANTAALELLSTYPGLAKLENAFVRVDGILRINRDVVDKYIEDLEEQAAIVQSAGTMGASLAKKKQAEIDKDKLLDDMQISAYNDQVENRDIMAGERQRRAAAARKIVEDNFESLANLTEEEYKAKLVELGVEGVFIDGLLEYQTKIDDLTDQADNAATELELVAKNIASILIGDGGKDKESVATQNILASKDYEEKYESEYDKLLAKYTGSGISKASGGNNDIYQEMLKELKKVEGYEDFNKARNGVQGTDNNRMFEFTVNGETKQMSAEEVAEIIAANKAKSSIESTDYADKAAKILEPLEKALGGDKELADILLGAIESGDYSGISADQIDKIKTAQAEGKLTDIISAEDQKELGINFSKGVQTAIDQWDPKEAEKALKSKLDQLYKGAAAEVDEDESVLRVLVEGIKANSKEFNNAEEDLIELAKQSLKFQKSLKTLGQTLADNKDILNKWSKSGQDAADMGYDTQVAVAKLKDQVDDLLGMDVSEDFLQENFDLITKAVNGSEEALDQLEIKAGKDFIINLDVEGIDHK